MELSGVDVKFFSQHQLVKLIQNSKQSLELKVITPIDRNYLKVSNYFAIVLIIWWLNLSLFISRCPQHHHQPLQIQRHQNHQYPHDQLDQLSIEVRKKSPVTNKSAAGNFFGEHKAWENCFKFHIHLKKIHFCRIRFYTKHKRYNTVVGWCGFLKYCIKIDISLCMNRFIACYSDSNESSNSSFSLDLRIFIEHNQAKTNQMN